MKAVLIDSRITPPTFLAGENIGVYSQIKGFGFFYRSGFPGQTSENFKPTRLYGSVSPIPVSQRAKVELRLLESHLPYYIK